MYNSFGTAVNLGSVGTLVTSSWGWDLGLNASKVTWLSEDEVRVEYDFTDDNQLLDFTPGASSGFSRNAGDDTINITAGTGNIDCVIWNLPMLCYMISSSHQVSLSGRSSHVNVYFDLASSWDGTPWNANPSVGAVGSGGGFFVVNGSTHTTEQFNWPNTNLVSRLEFTAPQDRSVDNQTGTLIVSYSNSSQTSDDSETRDLINVSSFPGLDGRVAFGAFQTDTIWGNVVFEGKVSQSIVV